MMIDILVVDDDEFFRKGMNMTLSRLEYVNQVYEAENGRQALRMMNDYNPNIVFMDVRMPKMDGIETTSLASQNFSRIKIIALSMFSEKVYLFNMIKAGAVGYILKDSGRSEIEASIEAVLQDRYYYSKGVS